MATPGQLIAKISEDLNVPARTVTVYDRKLREAGLLSKFGRGRGSVHRSPLDTARILIAILGTDTPVRAAEVVKDFGALERYYDEAVPASELNLVSLCGKQFADIHTLEDAISAVIAGFGQDEFRNRLKKYSYSHPGWRYDVVLEVSERTLRVELKIKSHYYRYGHRGDLESYGDYYFSDEPSAKDRRSYESLLERYRGIPTTRRIDLSMIKPIAEFIAGIEAETDAA